MNNDNTQSFIELFEKVNSLENLYNQTLQNLNSNILLFWQILFGVFALVGASLVYMTKQLIANQARKEIDKIKEEVQNELNDYKKKIEEQDLIINEFKGKITISAYKGEGVPEGRVTAPVGTIYLREDGTQGSTLWIKESGTGNCGWSSK